MQTLLRVAIAACLTLLSWQSHAQFNGCKAGFCGGGGGGGGTLTWGIDGTNFAGVYNTSTMALVCPSASCTVSGSSSTNFGIGTASSNRLVLVSFGYLPAGAASSGQITGVRINGTASGSSCTGGTAATSAADGFSNSSDVAGAAVWYAPVPTGTTASICFTAVGGNGWGGQAVVTVSYLNDSLGAAHAAVASTVTASPNPGYPGNCAANTCTNSATITVPSGGIGVFVGITDLGSLSSSSWSGTASPTKAVETFNSASVTSPVAYATASGVVTETLTSFGGAAGYSGAIFAP